MLKKFLQDYFSYQLSHIVGGRKYSQWANQTLALQKNIPIKNKKLAKELEDACQKNGFLTYAAHLAIDQFGTNGYHPLHRNNGMTTVIARWPKALLALCQKNKLHHIVEFGPGDGELGARTILAANKKGYPLTWSGIEINKKLRRATETLFAKKHIAKYLQDIVPHIEDLTFKRPCLFVFSYSLDNLPPEVFLNTTKKRGYPNAMLGITVKNGLLSEKILSQKEMRRIGWRLQRGTCTTATGISWQLKDWQLFPMQRAYLQLAALETLILVARMLPAGSQLLIIDEFVLPRYATNQYHIGLPKDIETYTRTLDDFAKMYKTAGENLLYYPLFLTSTVDVLAQLGFSLEANKNEHQFAGELSQEKIHIPEKTLTHALLTAQKKQFQEKKHFVFVPPVAFGQKDAPVA